jgi:predicted nucleic acid-binding protein
MDTALRSSDVCVDTCVFVNFAIVGRVEVMVRISDFTFHVPQEVADEVIVDAQKQKLEEMLGSGGLKRAHLQSIGELEQFARHSQRFGKGESACLAIAGCRRWVFATDETKDKRLKKEIAAAGVRIVNTPGLLLKAIHQGLLTVGEADSIKAALEKNRFKMDFDSFQEFARGPSTLGSK